MPGLTVTSNFVGTNIVNILSLLVLGAETITKGLLHTIPNKYDNIYLPFLNTAPNQLQTRKATPETADSADSVYSEKVIEPKDLMWYQEFNPSSFEAVWRDFWPTGPMVNQIQDIKIMAAVVKTIRGSLNTQQDLLTWQGDDAGAPELAFYDGFLKIMKASAETVKVVIAAPIDAATIQAILDEMITAMPPAVRNNKNPKFVVSHATFDAFGQYTTALDFKGTTIFEATRGMYRGFQIVPVGGMTDADIVFCDASSAPDSALFAGTWMDNDRNNFKIERLQNNSELFFIKALYRYGVQIGNDEEIVIATHTP